VEQTEQPVQPARLQGLPRAALQLAGLLQPPGAGYHQAHRLRRLEVQDHLQGNRRQRPEELRGPRRKGVRPRQGLQRHLLQGLQGHRRNCKHLLTQNNEMAFHTAIWL
jgi:hypothetical protein